MITATVAPLLLGGKILQLALFDLLLHLCEIETPRICIQMSTVVMRVDLECDKCCKKIRKVLCKVQGLFVFRSQILYHECLLCSKLAIQVVSR